MFIVTIEILSCL